MTPALPLSLTCTLGPSSLGLVRALHEAGATTFRLNASHLDAAGLRAGLAAVDAAVPGAPVVIDLQGAKLRLGATPDRPVVPGDRVVFTLTGDEPGSVPIPHPELFAAAGPGATLLVDDGKIRLVVRTRSPDRLEAEVLVGGVVRSRKGVNVPDHPVELADLVAADRAAVLIGAARPGTSFAVSFLTTGREAAWVRRRAPGAMVIGKVERREAIANLREIDALVDELWICRGDLGAQLGEVAMARAVAAVVPTAFTKPVVLAGQVLEHLTHAAEPTRSEVCHVADVVARGYAGLVLSDETAIGDDPVRATTVARRLLDGFTR